MQRMGSQQLAPSKAPDVCLDSCIQSVTSWTLTHRVAIHNPRYRRIRLGRGEYEAEIRPADDPRKRLVPFLKVHECLSINVDNLTGSNPVIMTTSYVQQPPLPWRLIDVASQLTSTANLPRLV